MPQGLFSMSSVEALIAKRFFRTKLITRIFYIGFRNVLKDGISVGKQLVISEGITERDISKRLLIGNENGE